MLHRLQEYFLRTGEIQKPEEKQVSFLRFLFALPEEKLQKMLEKDKETVRFFFDCCLYLRQSKVGVLV